MLRKNEWTVDVFKEQMDHQVGLGRAIPQEEIRREILRLLRYTQNSSLILRENWDSRSHRREEPEVLVGNLWTNEVNTPKIHKQVIAAGILSVQRNTSWILGETLWLNVKESIFYSLLYFISAIILFPGKKYWNNLKLLWLSSYQPID